MHLQRWGFRPIVTWLGDAATAPPDARASYERACAAGVRITADAPDIADMGAQDLCIDALLGIGATRAPAGDMADCIARMNASRAMLLAVDTPSGLNVDTGQWLSPNTSDLIASSALTTSAGGLFDIHPRRHTLSLLTLKPGLFTAQGRDACGALWFDDLGVSALGLNNEAASAWLIGKPAPAIRPHATHKGSHGDVAVIGGETRCAARSDQAVDSDDQLESPAGWGASAIDLPVGPEAPASQPRGDLGPSTNSAPAPCTAMAGAALLAASAALHAGAGRVYVALLGEAALTCDTTQPELMFRAPASLPLRTLTVVCGCGGGTSVAAWLPNVLAQAPRLVLDADALNAIAANASLQADLHARAARQQHTVLTPHPLEAARLLACGTADVQQDRIAAAQALAARYQAVVVLKGSGTVVAAPGEPVHINPTGNARLGTAGTGDVLAGLISARLAAGLPALDAACAAVYQHGAAADAWDEQRTLTAGELARSLLP